MGSHLTLALLAALACAPGAAFADSTAVVGTGGVAGLSQGDELRLPDYHAPRLAAWGLEARLGPHAYSGPQWSGHDPGAYSSVAFEASALYRLRETFLGRVDGVATLGTYSSSHCEPDSASSCVSNRFQSEYLHVGARYTWKSPLGVRVLGQAGVGLQQMSLHWSVPAGDPNYTNSGHGSTSTVVPSLQLLAGAGVQIRSVFLFAAVEDLLANGTLPSKRGSGGFYNAAIPLSMGGELALLGVQVGL